MSAAIDPHKVRSWEPCPGRDGAWLLCVGFGDPSQRVRLQPDLDGWRMAYVEARGGVTIDFFAEVEPSSPERLSREIEYYLLGDGVTASTRGHAD